jgi:hypothetical protein
MSQTLSLYSPETIDMEDLAKFVAEIGGFFFDDARADAGVSRDGCHVWIYGIPGALAGKFEEPEQAVTTRLGRPVKVRLDLQLSSASGSEVLALDIASAFTNSWPSAVASAAVHRVMSSRELGSYAFDRTQAPNAMGRGLDLMVTSLPPLSGAVIELGGLVVPELGDDQAIAQQWAAEMNFAPDPHKDRALGFVLESNAGVCILRPTPCAEGETDMGLTPDKIHMIAQAKLTQPIRWHIGLVTGWGAMQESGGLCFALARRILRDCEGVVVGLFDTVLGADDISRLRGVGAFVDG